MRKLLLLVCLVVGLVLTAAPAQAATTVEQRIPIDLTVDACGETITLSGTLLAVFTVQQLPNGGYLVTSQFNPQGVSGTSSSGATYRGTGLTRDTTVFTPSGVNTSTFINRYHLVGTAGAPTYAVADTFHITVSPTGEVTALVSNSSVECV